MELVAVLEALEDPSHEGHSAARAHFEQWEASSPDAVALGLGSILASSHRPSLRQLAGIALKNAVKRRTLSLATLESLQEAAFTALQDPQVGNVAAIVIAALPTNNVPRLTALLRTSNTEGALRAIEAMDNDVFDDDCRRALLALLTSAPSERALRCARLAGVFWADDYVAVLSRTAEDPTLRYETLLTLRDLLHRGSTIALDPVAAFALRSLGDSAVALAACEWWAALAELTAQFSSTHRTYDRRIHPNTVNAYAAVQKAALPSLVPALLSAMRYNDDDVNSPDLITTPDDPSDVPFQTQWGGDYVEDDDDDDDDEDDDDYGGWREHYGVDQGSSWNLRKCAAWTLDLLSRTTEADLLSAMVPALEIQSEQWDAREAAVFAVGAVAAHSIRTVRAAAGTLGPFLIDRLRDPVPQVREITAWTLSRCFPAWGEEEQLRTVVASALAHLVTTEQVTSVMESVCGACGVLAQSLGPQEAKTLVLALAPVLTVVSRRARFAALDAVSTLAWHAPIPTDAVLVVFAALDDGFQHPDDVVPLLMCGKALAGRAGSSDPRLTTFYASLLTRCAAFADASRKDVTLCLCSFDVLANLLGLHADAINIVARTSGGWAFVERALSHDASPEGLAIASAAAMLVGDLVSIPAAHFIVDRVKPGLLRCLEAPVAVNLASNAAWALGELIPHSQDRSFLLEVARHLQALVVSDQPMHLRHHASLLLGRAAAVDLDALRPEALGPWFKALAADHGDATDLVHCFTAVCAIAHTDLTAFQDPAVATGLLAALAGWRRFHPPTPPPHLAVALKRLLHHLHPPLHDLPQGDIDYIVHLYG